MTTIHNQMMASMLAIQLEEQIAAFEANDGTTTWLNAASQALHPNDFEKLLLSCRKRAEKLRKEADGCPSRIWGWQKHFSQQEA